ncbi:ABC transporter permease [Erwinia sp. OLTSP20]|uniref:ABC transporter permease n=1 Tax=unclassified Erwinia TaxID=2622719 RepID=UPI000C18842E|nr:MULTISPECIES: ABC transporter permease [unclassified Erwinia]PIJ51015.1 ABC transporter permease [Erwinia sp. OAMSP11]PIJ73717.1 ABC transporter permease [Erwinia sp. OLSSP12]PIJ83074.1 ABC transporter permease [Erwinia sp. OLCASP19]PIJ85672.1 ABC transporter permease [Erwinia sp. OLMTSP26]PIJ87678.1 ABC transporter permease [Erwinia sp. OLMDSP33]
MKQWWQAFSTTLKGLLERPMWLMLLISLCLMSLIYAKGSVWDLPVGVIDQDHSTASYRIIRDLNATSKMNTVSYSSLRDALHDLGRRKLFAVIIMPQDLEKKMLAGIAVTIPVYGDATNRLAGGQIEMDVSAAYQEMLTKYQLRLAQDQNFSRQEAKVVITPFIGQTEEVFNPGIGFAAIIFPGLLVMLLQQTLLIASIRVNIVLRAKGNVPVAQTLGTLSALIPPWLFLSILLYILWPWVLGYRQTGSVAEVLLLTFPFLLAVLGFGKFITECLGRIEHIYLTLTFITTPVYYLSGMLWPLQSMPVWINLFTHLFPSTWQVNILASVNQMGRPWQQTLPGVGMLLLLGAGWTLCGLALRWLRLHRQRRRLPG